MGSKYLVYIHTSPNGKKYVGITCRNVKKRWGSDGQGYKSCRYFHSAIVKYGWDNIIHEIIADGLSEVEAKKLEKDLISIYKTRNRLYGYNMTDGGDGVCGYRHSEEAKKKMGAKHKGAQVTKETRLKLSKAGKGRIVTEETLKKMSAAQKGRQFTESAREKMSLAKIGNCNRLGIKHTDEARAKMSASKKGKKLTDETKARRQASRPFKAVECLSMDGAVIARYTSTVDANKKTGINASNILAVCKGKNKTTGGFKWRFAG